MTRRPPRSTLFPNTPLFRFFLIFVTAAQAPGAGCKARPFRLGRDVLLPGARGHAEPPHHAGRRLKQGPLPADRKSTRLNSSHANISYAVFCLKKKKKQD